MSREDDLNNSTRQFEKESESSTRTAGKRTLADFADVEENGKKKELGKGSYGAVRLVRERKTGNLYAMKTVSFPTEGKSSLSSSISADDEEIYL